MDSIEHVGSNNVQSIGRVFSIIEMLSCHPNGMALNDLTAKVGLHKSTTHRLLATLVELDYVIKDTATGKYRLSYRLFEIGSRAIGEVDILSIARPYLEALAKQTNEAVHLVVREGHEVIYLYKKDVSDRMVRMASRVGMRNPMYCTGVGKAYMAFLPKNEARDIWDHTEILPYTSYTITSFDLLWEQLNAFRAQGYATDKEEHEYGVQCIACPIFNYKNSPIAAISIAAPSIRMNQENLSLLIPMLRKAAEQISHLSGCPSYSQATLSK